MHDGLHDAIISQELWDKVQEKLQRKAPCERGEAKHKQRNLLTGLIFDEYEQPYTPSFTSRKGQQYRYYYNLAFARNKQHPDYMRARFPAHEIENVVEQTLRRHVGEFLSEPDDIMLTHIQKHCATIPTDEWLRACRIKVVVHYNHVVIACHPLGLQELLEKYLNVSVTCMEQEIELNVSYQSKRGREGAKIIRSGQRDTLDLSPEDLKRLVQGMAWRDEHFAGTYIKDIAGRENCSDRYVRNRIMASFEFPYWA